MKSIWIVTILIYAVSEHSQAQKLVGDLPDTVINEILTTLTKGVVHVVGDCNINLNASESTYWLATRNNTDVEIKNLSQIDFGKPIFVLIHGWQGYKIVDYIVALRDAYLKRYDANVIILDYQPYSNNSYVTSYCGLPKVAINFAKFACDLNQFYKLSNVHVVGHSLGAQLAGKAAYFIQKMCGVKFGRITALDAAGPLYQGVAREYRLDKSDADFVDVIHTNQGQYGYVGDIGHVDFYPNCGTFQPDCFSMTVQSTSILNISSIINFPLNYVVCNHVRSCFYFAASINNNSFYSTSCPACGAFLCHKSIGRADHTYMGESCRSPQKSRAYTLKTTSTPPYALGPEAPLS